MLAVWLAFAFAETVPGWLMPTALLVMIVAAGAQFPMMLILGGVIGEDVTDRKLLRWRHPFAVFKLWWDYVR